jgi:ABC-2 type transport system permease protein
MSAPWLRAEWTKLRTDPATGWLLAAVVALTVLVSAAAAAAMECPAAGCTADPAKIGLSGIALGQAVVAIVAVLAISGEYGTGMIRTTLQAMPRRITMLGAKAAIVTTMALAAGAVAVLGSVQAGRLLLPDGAALSLGAEPVLRATAGSVLYLALIGLFSLGIATAVRDSATAIGIVLGLLYLFPIITQVVTDPDWERRLHQIGPMNAGLAIQATTNLDDLPIGPWAGLGVLAAWSTAAFLTGALLLHHRDA